MTPKTEVVTVAAQLPSLSPDQIVDTVRDTVAKGATDAELQMFLQVCKRFDLDPFAREVFFIKEKPGEPGRIQAGRDAFLAIANRHPAYDGMDSDVVFSGDVFRRTSAGDVEHVYDLENRKGVIVGAYAVVYRTDRRRPSYAFARNSEYAPKEPKGWSPWHKYPSAMILKVAETAALKKAFSISGLTPIGVSEPDDDYVDAPQDAPRPALPYAKASAQFGTAEHGDAPRPNQPDLQRAEGGEHILTAEDLEEAGQTGIFDEPVIPE